MANPGENYDPVRILGGKRIIFGSRSAQDANDAKNWDCPSCGQLNRRDRKLVFDLPVFNCKCGQKFDGELDFCLANVKANDIQLLGIIKQQEPGESECIPYAMSSTVEIMHNFYCALSGRSPQSMKNSVIHPSVSSLWYKKTFPGLKNGLHKILHLCQKIRKEGVYFVSGEYYQVGKTKIIHCDDFEKICRLIADGIPVMATLTTGYKYPDLQYCQLYMAVPVDEPKLQKIFRKPVEGGHMLCLIGAVQTKDGQRGFYGLDAAGELFCPQFVSAHDDIGVVPAGGFGKVNANSDFTFNFLAFARKEDCEDDKEDDVELLEEDENAIVVSTANQKVMVHGEYFEKQLAVANKKLASFIPFHGEDDGDAPDSSTRSSAKG